MRIQETGRFLDKVTEIAVTVVGVSIFVLGVAQVFFRYVVQASLGWSEELSRYLFIWLIFIGSALAIPRGMHIAIDIAVSDLPIGVRKWVQTFVSICVMAFFIFLAWEGIRLCNQTWAQTSPAMEIPIGAVYACIPVGSLLMFFNILRIFSRPGKG